MKLKVLLEDDAQQSGKSSEFAGKYHIGWGYYSSKPGGEAEFKNDNGVLKPLSQAEKDAHKNKSNGATATSTQSQPTPTPASSQAGSAAIDRAKSVEEPSSQPQQTTPSTTTDKKAVAKRISVKIKNWAEHEKQFFKDNVHKGNSVERRTIGKLIKDKLKGTYIAVKNGFKHEMHTFKEAGLGAKNLLSGKKLDPNQAKALKSIGTKILTVAAFGVITGGLSHAVHAAHGAVGEAGLTFASHVIKEFIPHVIGETVALGAARAAIFAGAEDESEDAYMLKFLNHVIEKLENEDIPIEVLEKAIDSYNASKGEASQSKNIDTIDVKELKAEMKSSLTKMMKELNIVPGQVVSNPYVRAFKPQK
jgi:hypothetical protein